MELEHLARQVADLVPPPRARTPEVVRPLPGLKLLAHPQATAFEATLYEPVVCVVVRGHKETTFGGQTYGLRAGECLLISHDLPVVSRIDGAPYLAILLDVDLGTLRGLHGEIEAATRTVTPPRALEVQPAPGALFEALGRYLALSASPIDAQVLGPSVVREIHYRLLMAPFGGMLRRLLHHDSYESAISRAIAHIRRDFRAPIAVPELARAVGMSAPSFHKHFKAITAATPLQYQKALRLLEARRGLRAGEGSVATVAFAVGYESPSQFSREYARKFGVAPSKDASG